MIDFFGPFLYKIYIIFCYKIQFSKSTLLCGGLAKCLDELKVKENVQLH